MHFYTKNSVIWFPLLRKAVFVLGILIASIAAYAGENSSILYREGTVLAGQGDYSGAIAKFKRAAELSPRFALAHYGLGRVSLFAQTDGIDAVKELSLAVECDRRLAKGFFYLGFACMFAKKYNRAITAFAQAYALDRTFIESLYNIAVLYEIRGNVYKASSYYRQYFNVMDQNNIEFR